MDNSELVPRAVRRPATVMEDQFIAQNAATSTITDIAATLGRSRNFISYRMQKMQISLPEELTQERIAASHFKSGHTPPNTGMLRESYMSQTAAYACARTQFQPGHEGGKYEEGHISIRQSADSRPYLYIRDDEGKWHLLHHNIWAAVNGPVPTGHIIRFKDGNTLHCAIENLECISLQENMRRNSYMRFGPALAAVIRLRGALTRHINAVIKATPPESGTDERKRH